jgi:hypothetical protein
MVAAAAEVFVPPIARLLALFIKRSDAPADWARDSNGLAWNLIYGAWEHGPGPLPAPSEPAAIFVVTV